jgi:anti-sigma B factor antagonist/stage II sporulation protein AA (anti-sigma F factor antagonist)
LPDASDASRPITPAPDLDIASAPQLGAEVLDHLGRGNRDLVLDFAGVRMVDSAAIGILLSANRRVRAAGGRMTVVNASEHVLHVFELTGVGKALSVDR